MKVQVEGNLYIESDGMQFIIKEYTGKTDDKGRALYKTHGYFGTVQGAMRKVLKMNVMESSATTVKELIADINRIENKLKAVGV